MPVFFEAEEPDGTTYLWVLDDEDLGRVIEVLGHPDLVKC